MREQERVSFIGIPSNVISFMGIIVQGKGGGIEKKEG